MTDPDNGERLSRLEAAAIWAAVSVATFGILPIYVGLLWLLVRLADRLDRCHRRAVFASIDAADRSPHRWTAILAATAYLIAFGRCIIPVMHRFKAPVLPPFDPRH